MILLDGLPNTGYNSESLVDSLMGQGLVDTYMIASAGKMCAIASGLASIFFFVIRLIKFVNFQWNSKLNNHPKQL